MKSLRPFIYAVLPLLVSACEIPFALDNVSEPAIYIEMLPSAPYSTMTFKVGYADAAFGKPAGLHPVKVEDISLYLNDKAVSLSPELISDRNMITVAADLARLSSGDRIDISVKCDGAPTASAGTVIPPVPEIASVSIEPAVDDTTNVSKRVTVKLSRPVQEGEYMGMRILEKNTIVTARTVTDSSLLAPGLPPLPFTPVKLQIDTNYFYTYKLPGQVASRQDLNSLDLDAFANADYLGGPTEEGRNVIGSMMLMTAKQFDGDTYSFYVSRGRWYDSLIPDDFEFPEREYDFERETDDGEAPPETIEIPEENTTYYLLDNADYVVEVYRLSEELYNYLKARYLMNFNLLSNFGVTPPNFTYSNVRGGLGIVGGISGTRSEWFPNPDNTEGVSPEELLRQIVMSGR